MKEINLEALSMVCGGSMYSVDEWGYGDILERYYFENPRFM